MIFQNLNPEIPICKILFFLNCSVTDQRYAKKLIIKLFI